MEFAETPLLSAKKALYLELMLQMGCYLLMFVDKVQVRRPLAEMPPTDTLRPSEAPHSRWELLFSLDKISPAPCARSGSCCSRSVNATLHTRPRARSESFCSRSVPRLNPPTRSQWELLLVVICAYYVDAKVHNFMLMYVVLSSASILFDLVELCFMPSDWEKYTPGQTCVDMEETTRVEDADKRL
jgi:hypothetical protein